jgi:hypothetical protein
MTDAGSQPQWIRSRHTRLTNENRGEAVKASPLVEVEVAYGNRNA